MTLQNAFGDIALDATVQEVVDAILAGIAPKDNLKGTAAHGATNRITLQFAAILSGGSGHAVGDILTLAGGTFATAAKIEVLSVSAGVITKVRIVDIGRYSASTGTLTQGSTTGTGTGATFTATWVNDCYIMVDTTGFNYFQFAWIAGSGNNCTIQGSFDDGLTWVASRWYAGNFGSFSPINGTTGSASNQDIHYYPMPAPLIRLLNNGNNTIGWSLRNVSGSTNVVTQGANSGSNQFWFTRNSISVFSNAPGHATGGGGGNTKVISSAGTNATLISNNNKNIFSMHLTNTHATDWAYFKVFNKATTPVPGTDIPVAVWALAPNGGKLDIDADVAGIFFHNGGNGIGYSITGQAAGADTTAVAANQVVGTITWN